MKKKLLALILAAAATVTCATGLSACNKNNEADTPKWGSEYSFATAYAQAQDLGYTGSLEEFIAMISGKDGANGTNGKDGNDGKSAYQIWLDNGNTGSQADFLDWLKGTNGTDGIDGIDGIDGVGVKQAGIDESGHLIITLTNDKKIDCGKILDTHKHEYDEWITLYEENCLNSGLRLRICKTCNYTEANVIPVSDKHDWSDWQESADKDGHTRKCSVCENTEEAPHEMVDGVCKDCRYIETPTFIVPLRGNIITNYGIFKNSLDTFTQHNGVDIAADEGSEVVASLSGTVEEIITDDRLVGTQITVAHKNGFKTVYRFVDVKAELKVGDAITKGEVLGTVTAPCGNESTFAAHLHFEIIKDEKAVDPEEYIDFSDK